MFPGRRCCRHTDGPCPHVCATSDLISCPASFLHPYPPQAPLEQLPLLPALLARILTYITGW